MIPKRKQLCNCYLFVCILSVASNARASDFLFRAGSDSAGRLLVEDENLRQLLGRVGPNMMASSDYHDYQDIHINESIAAWKILYERSKSFAASQVQLLKPELDRTLSEANVSSSCMTSASKTLDAMEKLESWSIQMWSSTGSFPPVGLLDGQLTDLGSYRGCVDLSIPYDLSSEASNSSSLGAIGVASYCTMAFRPIIPSRPRSHMIFHEVSPKLIHMFGKNDFFYELARRAHFYHYIYLKTGVCVPEQCTARDIQQVAGVFGRRLALMPGPVKCFSRSAWVKASEKELEFSKTIENEPFQIRIDQPANTRQVIAISLVAGFFTLVFLATIWHAIEIVMRNLTNETNLDTKVVAEVGMEQNMSPRVYSGARRVAFYYLSAITNGEEFLETSMRSNEIKCLHGLRVLTMWWIICIHFLQYNDWSQFTRNYENFAYLQSFSLHPIYNGKYLVDNFFFMSGLLAAYTTWFSNKGKTSNFRPMVSLLARYLRLTPQVLLVSLLYIILPLLGDGPFWYDMTHNAAKYCEKNWWVNLFHVQAFFREDEMCNLVSWWISVDMFFYVVALALIYMILTNHSERAMISTMVIVFGCVSILGYKHYTGGHQPGILGTIPQVGEVWTDFVVDLLWSPYNHAYSYFLGFWIGYIIAGDKWGRVVIRWSRLGCMIAITSLATINLSTYIWMSGAVELGDQYLMTAYDITCTVIWSTALAWLVISFHYGYLQSVSNILSTKPMILLSKASFIIYLSHMLIVRLYFGLQNTLIEISMLNMSFSVVSVIFVSSVLGVFLCITFEGPMMKLQKSIIESLKLRNQQQVSGKDHTPDEQLEQKLPFNNQSVSVSIQK